jgi:hypothetical protein
MQLAFPVLQRQEVKRGSIPYLDNGKLQIRKMPSNNELRNKL